MAEPNLVAFHKTSTWPTVPHYVALNHSRRSLIRLLGDRPDAAGLLVWACHGIDMLDLVRHLTANCHRAEAVLTGRLRTTPETARPDQLGLPELLEEWERSGSVVERALRTAHGQAGALLVMDSFTHELYARRTLGSPEPGCHPAMPASFDVVVGGAGAVVGRLALPAIRFVTDGATWIVGHGEPAVSVEAKPMDLYRSLVGQLTLREIRQLDWSADPEPWLRVFSWGPFFPPDESEVAEG